MSSPASTAPMRARFSSTASMWPACRRTSALWLRPRAHVQNMRLFRSMTALENVVIGAERDGNALVASRPGGVAAPRQGRARAWSGSAPARARRSRAWLRAPAADRICARVSGQSYRPAARRARRGPQFQREEDVARSARPHRRARVDHPHHRSRYDSDRGRGEASDRSQFRQARRRRPDRRRAPSARRGRGISGAT